MEVTFCVDFGTVKCTTQTTLLFFLQVDVQAGVFSAVLYRSNRCHEEMSLLIAADNEWHLTPLTVAIWLHIAYHGIPTTKHLTSTM
jgi:hypothetical protein